MAKDKHKEKQRLSKRRKRQAKTEEETKSNNEKERLNMNRKRPAKTEEQTKSHRKNDRLAKKGKRLAETDKQTKLRRENNRLNMKRKRQAKTEEQTKLLRENDRLAKNGKCQAKTEEQTANCCAKIEEHKDDMANVIDWSMKEAMKILHRTKDPANPHKHRAIVCIIWDHCIIGTEAICKLTKEQILLHKKRLSVERYEEYYETTLKPKVTKQYQINVDDLKCILLSP